jgi:hypothetical protein
MGEFRPFAPAVREAIRTSHRYVGPRQIRRRKSQRRKYRGSCRSSAESEIRGEGTRISNRLPPLIL